MATPSTRMLDTLSRDSIRTVLIRELEDLTGRGTNLSHADVGMILGQWYHPLHYFPIFLSRLVSLAPTIEMQAIISKILWQELGQGDPELAHEKVYIDTMVTAGFDLQSVAHAAPSDATANLIRGYENACSSYLPGLGFLYGTEVADLAMVSTVGGLVRNCTDKRELPWVDIHIQQEPDHVASSSRTLLPAFSAQEQQQIVSKAQELWGLWAAFFAELKLHLLG
ncbi:MAG TPA: iron-containing redox enzyme family protein [Blastocatellia bacterium]|nr:iron-containing redox enzyme family protein [Blastocatellia bacterium]